MNIDTVKSNLAHLASDAIEHGQEALQAPVGRATDKLASLSKVVAAATSAKAISRMINPDVPMNWVLGAMGLQRRPSVLARIATGVGLVAVGAAVGAGVAMLFSPHTGQQNRALIQRRVKSLRREAEQVADEVGTRALDVAHDVESRARDIARDVETTARDAVQSVETAAHNALQDGDGTKDQGARGGAGTGSNTKPRTPGLSHRAPKA
jgi:gas vesicle protein